MSAASARPLLVLVHPGSCCGSANMNLGLDDARLMRGALSDVLRGWSGDVLVLDSDLSDELGFYPVFNGRIKDAAARAQHAARVAACEDTGEGVVASLKAFMPASQWGDPASVRCVITGAWYHEDDNGGCVNGAVEALSAMGYDCEVCSSAFTFDAVCA